MRSLLIVFFSLILIFVSGFFFLVWPNTYLSQINISWWPKPIVRRFLESKNTAILNLIVEETENKIKYRDLAMILDVDQTMKGLSPKSINDLINNWVNSTNKTTLIQPVFIFGDDFDRLAQEKFPAKPLINEEISYDNKSGLFVYQAEQRKSIVDTTDLQAKLVTFSGIANNIIKVEMVNTSNELEKSVETVNRKLSVLLSKPVEVQMGKNSQKIIIEPHKIRELLDIKTKDALKTLEFLVDKDKMSKILAENNIGDIPPEWPTKVMADSLRSSYSDGVSKPVVLGIDSGPNTGGEIADKYIEVDLSQQRMFFFEKGSLYKSYSVSTGLRYPTPIGSYKIKNKIPMGFSSIFGVWMPWWMAFDYREDIGAYLGIHELPYKLTDGEKIYRFGNYIGSRKTGGCIALAPGDSKEVYDNSFAGMDIVVYD